MPQPASTAAAAISAAAARRATGRADRRRAVASVRHVRSYRRSCVAILEDEERSRDAVGACHDALVRDHCADARAGRSRHTQRSTSATRRPTSPRRPRSAARSTSISLADALAKGPVVLYFFPAAFSDGCSIEAHEFAEAIAQFEALGATVIGVSADDIDTLGKFSVQACQGKFPVASDNKQDVMKSYDAVLKTRPDYANRISYVIAPNGTVVYNYMSLNPTKHVEKMLAALKDWSQSKK